MHSEILPLSGLEEQEFAAWRALAGSAISPNPFMEPDYVLPSVRAWGVDDVGMLVVRDGRAWLAAVAVREVRAWKGVPGRCLTTWRHDYCYLGTPLVAADDPAPVLAALVERGLKHGRCLALEWIDDDGPLQPALAEVLPTRARPVVLDRFERASLRRVNGAEVELRLSTSNLKSYARRRRQLDNHLGPLTLRDESDDPAAYERFLEIEDSGWKGEFGTAMARRPGHDEWFLEVCRRFAEAGRLQLLSLANDEHTVAMNCDLVAGSTLFCMEGCFAEAFARYSPGIQLDLAAMGHLNSRGYELIDSCTAADNATLNRLWPARRRLQSVIALSRRVDAAAAYAKWKAVAGLLPLRRRLRKPPPGVRGH